MKLKKSILLGILLFSTSLPSLYAQEAVLAGGGDASGTGSLSYSIGQVFYITNTGSDGTVGQGVQQAYEISSTLGIEAYEAITLDLEIYPNPTVDYLTLDVKDFKFAELDYVLFDMRGKMLMKNDINQNKTTIEMMDLPKSMYFLKVSDGTNIVKTFKIIKN
tara:strand:+ start:371 stop:856 length:486 start_codon:yes stop_codon:yes gene_type:complete